MFQSLGLIISLLLVFMGYPLFAAYKAKEQEKLKVFVISIFGPFFSWIFIFMLVHLVTYIALHHNPFEKNMGWIFIYLSLQATFFAGFKHFKLLK